MRYSRYSLLFACITATFTAALPSQIKWEDSLQIAMAKAKTENRVLFIALNMDGERANDQMVSDHYRDTVLTKLSRQTVNLFCSNNTHSKSGRCPRCKGTSCSSHRTNDVMVRRQILKVDGETPVVAPQHLFVGPDGTVISSASYFITKGELEWMWVQAIKKLNVDFTYQPSGRVRAPEQLRKGSVDTATITDKPPTAKEVKAALREVKKMSPPQGRDIPGWARFFDKVQLKARTLIRSDDKKAIEWGKATMRSYKDLRDRLIEDVGDYAPKAWAKMLEEWVDAKSDETRMATIVALEKLANPKSVKALKISSREEEIDGIKGRSFRAMAACGPTNRIAIRAISQAVASNKSPLVRSHAVVAAGKLEDRKAISQCLKIALADKNPMVRSTAIYVIAVRQDHEMLPTLKTTSVKDADTTVTHWAKEAIKAIENEDHSPFKKFLVEVLDDHDGKFDEERSARWEKFLKERDKGK